MTHRPRLLAALAGLCTLAAPLARADTAVVLRHPTATFSQSASGPFKVARAIDGIVSDGLGWAIFPAQGSAQTAVFETARDVGLAGGTRLTFRLTHAYPADFHTLGRLRLSVTTDDRDSFADGLAINGDVTANWTVLMPDALAAANDTHLSLLADGSILASGPHPNNEVYTLSAVTHLAGITGIRLEALKDASLPGRGPGRAINGNFVLSEFEVQATPVPEPGTGTLLALGIGGLLAAGVRRAPRLQARGPRRTPGRADNRRHDDAPRRAAA